ncbi:protein SMAX1-LIKE 4-like [Gastrolobium bilobum]|uniref:protein SMAX1-LIKE 4-like n=1 Tax=Gastrolobium bilobum TaxID=150636 RepID=UPI002AB131F5|nr:protein SMAX1-LIKE 4-like [Gastrolobium bilobum]
MRSGACTLQQTLTAEAASVLKHSLGLARRRGHAQVTPLHVAATLLSLRASSLRRACLKSQPHQTSHPLQCRALELCFNVALNRLPTTPGPLLHTQPSLSNALIAALKRAQAHQRRGCIEQQQQQPLLTIKVELEQLIISILDDPSVSRVMREAGFSSTAVKNNIEDSSAPSVFQCYNSSGGVFSSPCSPSPSENQRETIINPSSTFRQNHNFLAAYTSEYSPVLFSPQKKAPVYPITESPSSKDDIKLVLDIFLRKKKKNTVIVGDSVSLTEGLLGELMGKLERGEVPDELKSTHFIKFQFTPVSLRFMKRDEVEMNLSALKRKVDSIASGRGGGGAIFYVGDLKWIMEASLSEKEGGFHDGEVSGYNPVDHLVTEIGKLFSDQGNSNTKVWLMATASYQTYMRCQMRQPPLETQWALQAVPVPSGGLGLSLHASSVHDSKMTISQNPTHMVETKLFGNKEDQEKLNCCEECASNYEKEAQLFKPGQKKLLPSWLQSNTTEAHQKDELTQLKIKWNRLCHCLHQSKQPQNHWSKGLYGNHSSNGKIYPYNSSYPWWPNQGSVFPDSSSISFADSAAYSSNVVPRFRRQQSCTIEFNFSDVIQKKQSTETTLDSLKGMEGKEVKITLALGNSTFGGSGETVANINDRTLRRAHICELLQGNVPWQSETVPSIAEALVDSKSAKQSATWLFMQGTDSIGKTRLARAIAESVFGSVDLFLHLDMQKRENSTTPFSEVLVDALKTHEQLVILIENVDSADAQFKKFLADGFETAKFGNLSAEQAIFILSNGGNRSNQEQDKDSVMRLVLQMSETKPTLESSSPYLGHKRRAELDLFTKIKNPRIEEKEEVVLVSEQGKKKKDFSRQSSFNNLDLNMKADEVEDGEDKTVESSPISSDLTRETIADPMNSNGFLDSIENRFDFNQSPARDREMAELFLSKIKESFEDVCGKKYLVNFTVEERVIEEIRVGCGSFTNSMFEKWLKDIFQSSLQTVNFDGKEGIVFTLCWGGKEDRKSDNGFMSSCLPKKIQVNYFMD